MRWTIKRFTIALLIAGALIVIAGIVVGDPYVMKPGVTVCLAGFSLAVIVMILRPLHRWAMWYRLQGLVGLAGAAIIDAAIWGWGKPLGTPYIVGMTLTAVAIICIFVADRARARYPFPQG